MKHRTTRTALLVCLLVLAVTLCALLATSAAAADDTVTALTDYGIVLTDGTTVVINGTLSDANLANNPLVKYTFAGEEKELTPTESTFSLSVPVGAAQMNEPITVGIYLDGAEEPVMSGTVSVRSYIAEQITSADEATKQLMSELVHYGAAVSTYLGRTEDAEALSDIEGLADTAVFPHVDDVTYTYTAGEQYKKLGLTLTNFLKLTFKPTEGEHVAKTVMISEFFNPITVGDVTASASYYVAKMWDSAEVGAVVKALYNYAYAAHVTAGRHVYTDGACVICGKVQASTEGLAYELNADGTAYTVTGIGTATDTDIVIPNEYNGKPVTGINAYAFYSRAELTSVTIGGGVVSIGSSAFRGCTSLETVTFAEGSQLTSIGSSAFSGCTSLTSITIPDSVVSIGDYAFADCTSLTSITYEGTMAQWESITKYGYWNINTGAYTVHCTDGDIAKNPSPYNINISADEA